MLDLRQTYPDLHLTIDRQIAEGDWVVTQVTAKGHASCVLARHEADRQRRRNHCRQSGLESWAAAFTLTWCSAANSLEALLTSATVACVGPETEKRREPGAPPNGGRTTKLEIR